MRLKIDNNDGLFPIEKIIQAISKVDQIAMVYPIDQDKLKSKNNLIF